MRQLMGDGGGEETGGTVCIQVCFTGKGEEKAGKVDVAHDPGEKDPLGGGEAAGEKGKFLADGVVDAAGFRKDFVPADGKAAGLVPLHLRGVLVYQLHKIACGGGKVIGGDRQGFNAAFIGKAVAVIVDTPQQAEAGVDGQNCGAEPGDAAVKDDPAETSAGAEHPVHGLEDQDGHADDPNCPDQLRHGEGQQGEDSRHRLFIGGGDPADQKIHQPFAGAEEEVKPDHGGGDQGGQVDP